MHLTSSPLQTTDLLTEVDTVIDSHGLKKKAATGAARALVLSFQAAIQHGAGKEAIQKELQEGGEEAARVTRTVTGKAVLLHSHSLACIPSSFLLPIPWPLSSFAGVSAEAAAAAAEAFGLEQGKLVVELLGKPKPSSAGRLLDADWRLGVSVSTEELDKLGSTYLQLRLTSQQPAGAAGAVQGGVSVEHLELSVGQFYDLLAQLEKAKQYMDYLAGGEAAAAAGK